MILWFYDYTWSFIPGCSVDWCWEANLEWWGLVKQHIPSRTSHSSSRSPKTQADEVSSIPWGKQLLDTWKQIWTCGGGKIKLVYELSSLLLMEPKEYIGNVVTNKARDLNEKRWWSMSYLKEIPYFSFTFVQYKGSQFPTAKHKHLCDEWEV